MTGAQLRRQAVRERARRVKASGSPSVDVAKICHRKQASLVNSLVLGIRRNICALAGRQSGKSHGGALASCLIASRVPGVNVIYVTSTYATCKKMAFLPAVEMNRTFTLGGTPNHSEMSMAFPNGSVVYFLGADNAKTIERLRGTPNLVLCIIDEAGIYDPETLETMIRAVRPGLRPRAGKLCVMGTPSKAGKQGTFYDITQNQEYEQHRFDYRDNDKVPNFTNVEDLIDEDLRAEFPDLTPEQRRLTAYFLREYLALFEVDLAEKVYQLADKNLVDRLPEKLDTYLTGGDIGVSAEDALVSLGWDEMPVGHGDVWVMDQETARGQDSIACADMVNAHNDLRNPIEIAMDPGGLGQKTIKTVERLYPAVPITEAEKPPIGIQVRAVNYLLQGGDNWCLRIKRGSRLALELSTPTWMEGKVGGEIDEHGKHSDLVPALRYAALKARKYLPEVKRVLSEAEKARAAHLERVRRAEKLAKKAKARDSSYDPDEFGDDLTDDLDQ